MLPRPRSVLITGATVALVWLAWIVAPPLPPLDDPFIALHSAQVWLSGQPDPIYGTPALTGATSPPHVALLAVILAVGVPPLETVRVVAALGLVAVWLSAWWLSAGLSTVRRAAFLAIITPVFYFQATNGMETGFALACVMSAMAASRSSSPRLTAALCGAAVAMRPDLIFAAATIWLVTARRASRRERAVMFALAVVVVAPWALWTRIDAGYWLPNTLAAKRAFFVSGCQPLESIRRWAPSVLAGFALASCPLCFGVFGWGLTPLGRTAPVAVGVPCLAYAVAVTPALSWNEYRYLMALAGPWLALGLVDIFRTQRDGTHLALASVAVLVLTLPFKPQPSDAGSAEMIAAAAWIQTHTDASDTIVVQDAGALSVLANRHLVDFVGLKSPANIALHEAHTVPSCGAQRPAVIAMIARQAGARYLVVTKAWEDAFHIALGIPEQGGTLTTVREPKDGGPGYLVYRVSFAH